MGTPAAGAGDDGAPRIAVKRLFAPPADVEAGRVVLPRVDATPTVSRVAVRTARFLPSAQMNAGTHARGHDGPVDGIADGEAIGGAHALEEALAECRIHHPGGPLALLPLGPGAIEWSLEVAAADGSWSTPPLVPSSAGQGGGDARAPRHARPWRPGEPLAVSEWIGTQSPFGLEEPTRRLEVELPAGELVVRIRAPRAHGGRSMALAVADGSTDQLVAHLARRVMRPGEPVELVVRASEFALPAVGDPAAGTLTPVVDPTADADVRGHALGAPLAFAILRAGVVGSDGLSRPVAVAPGGTPDAPTSLLRSAPLPAGRSVWTIDALVLGRDGRWRERTIHYTTSTADGPRLAVTRGAHASLGATGWIEFAIPLDDRRGDDDAVLAAAEVWSRAGSDGAPPRCLGWIGGLAEAGADGCVRIGVARDAIGDTASATTAAGLELRQVRLHARDGWVPLDLVARMPVVADPGIAAERAPATTAGTRATAPAWSGPPGIASVGWNGRAATAAGTISSFTAGIGTHALMLVHGYCAGANPWPGTNFADDQWMYEEPEANLSHDAFALDLAAEGERFKSFGVIAHSQGGSAALHLYTFYWSGLDWAGEGRLIQALGTPFEGTALAGNLAALGEIFGVQCGSNGDMTYDGSAAWLSTIPTAARARVYTHTTTFTNYPFFYDYCSIATDFFLTDPEDGVTEHFSGHIAGANDMGLVAGWCHVGGMRDPDQTLDGSRNAVMNEEAAR